MKGPVFDKCKTNKNWIVVKISICKKNLKDYNFYMLVQSCILEIQFVLPNLYRRNRSKTITKLVSSFRIGNFQYTKKFVELLPVSMYPKK